MATGGDSSSEHCGEEKHRPSELTDSAFQEELQSLDIGSDVEELQRTDGSHSPFGGTMRKPQQVEDSADANPQLEFSREKLEHAECRKTTALVKRDRDINKAYSEYWQTMTYEQKLELEHKTLKLEHTTLKLERTALKLSHLEVDMKRKENIIDNYVKDLSVKNEQMKKLRQEKDDLNEKIHIISKDCKSKEDEMKIVKAELKKTCEEMNEKEEIAQNKVSDLTTKMDNLTATLQHLRQEKETAVGLRKAREKELRELRSCIAQDANSITTVLDNCDSGT